MRNSWQKSQQSVDICVCNPVALHSARNDSQHSWSCGPTTAAPAFHIEVSKLKLCVCVCACGKVGGGGLNTVAAVQCTWSFIDSVAKRRLRTSTFDTCCPSLTAGDVAPGRALATHMWPLTLYNNIGNYVVEW